VPESQNEAFDVQFDNALACARRRSGQYLKSAGQDELQIADPYGAAGPAIAGGIVGRMNPNQARDGKTAAGDVDVTKPAEGISEISCYMRETKDAGENKIGGEVLIVQTPLTKNVKLQAKLEHGTSMGGKDYSFHFHDYGDLRLLVPADKDKRRVGQIYNEGKDADIIKLKVLKIPQGETKTSLIQQYTLPDGVQGVEEYVGRSLTIHSGPDKSSPTVSYGVCGIANPDSSQQFYQTTIVYEEDKTASTAAALGLSCISLLVALFW
jgi:Cu/Zn superoxide dismutase